MKPFTRAAVTFLSASVILTFSLGTMALASPGRDHKASSSQDCGPSRHPSGKDRCVENGPGTQGRSPSDPDRDLNGGRDKPGGSGGLNALDQDGNNGCGNDQDFEDDNNGNCGGRHAGRGSAVEGGRLTHRHEHGGSEGSSEGDSKRGSEGGVGGSHEGTDEHGSPTGTDDTTGDSERGSGSRVSPRSGSGGAGVKGTVLTRKHKGSTSEGDELSVEVMENSQSQDAVGGDEAGSAGSALPYTGAGVLGFLVAAIGMLTAGALLLRRQGRA